MSRTTIAELVRSGSLVVGDGYRTKRSEHGQPGYRILRVADVGDGTFSFDGDDFVSVEFTEQIGNKLSQAGDVVLTTKGTVGRVGRIPDGLDQVVYSPQVCFFRVVGETAVLPRYLEFWFRSSEFKRQAANRANNTDMAAYINLADIRSLSLTLPAIDEQRAITEVLGALDDKIAANARLGATAVELADAHFAQAVKYAALGATFGELSSVQGGGTPRTKVEEYWNGDINWATPTDITALALPYLERTARRITDEGLAACSSALHPVGSILMTSRATIGAFAIAGEPTAVNQGFIVVNAHDPDLQWWLFHEMRSRVPEFLAHANGATFLELPRGKFKQFSVRLAQAATMKSFSSTARVLHARARAAALENVSLAETRDALLPALMSGKIRVKDAEGIVGEAV